MTTPTQGEHAQTAAQVQRYKIGYPTDSWGERSSTPSGIPDHAGAWVRYEDHAAQVAALTATPAQPAAPQCVAYAELDDAFESWLEDQDVDRLSDGYESWLNSVRSCWDSALRASHGQAPAGAADEMEINRPFEDPAPPFNQWRGEMQSALKRAGVYAARSPGAGNKLTLRWRTTREDVLPTPTAQAAPAAGAVAGPVWEQPVTVDFKQAAEILEMFGGAVGEVALMKGTGHSGHGLYAMWTADPEGTIYLGETDEDAAPTPAAQADSVLEDAARGYELVGYINRGIEYHNKGKTIFHIKPTQNLKARWWTPDIAVYAARKQGGV